MPLDRKQESLAATLQTFEQVGPAEAHQPLARAGQVLNLPVFIPSGGNWRRVEKVVAEAIPGQLQLIDGFHDCGGVKAGVLVVGIGLVNCELDRPRDAGREVGPFTVFVGEKFPASLLVRLRVVVLDEAAGPAHQV